MHALPDPQLPKLVVAPRVDQSAVEQHQEMPGTHRDLLDLASLQRSANAQVLIQLRVREVLPRGLRSDAFGDVEIARAREISAIDRKSDQNPIRSVLQASFAMSTLASEGRGAKLGLCRTSTEDLRS